MKIPAELHDAERDENEVIELHVVRRGTVRVARVPRWIDAMIGDLLHQRDALADAMLEGQRTWHRHYFAGYLAALALAMVGRGDDWYWTAGIVAAAVGSCVVLGWPGVTAWWRDWRDR